MAYNHPIPLDKGEYYLSYPHIALELADNEKKFKQYLQSYLKVNAPTSIAVGITSDLKLVCRENPENTMAMVRERQEERKKPKGKKGKK